MFEKVEEKLKELNIKYQIIEHKPALTKAQADKYIEGVDGIRTKTMFLTNKNKKNFYLVVIDDAKRLNMEKFKEIVGEKRIKLASEDSLLKKMALRPGVVSPFGLLNNSEKDIQIYFDKEIVNENRMGFHPNTNEKTLFIRADDLFTFLKNIDYSVNIVEL